MSVARLASTALACSLALCGCVSVPPVTSAPALRSEAPLLAPAAAAQTGNWPPIEWWRRYQDPTLDELVKRAREKSPTLVAAAAQLEAARAQLRLASAARGIHIEATGTAERQRLSDNGLLPPQFLGFHWYDQYDLGLRASYRIDWWGEQRAAIAAAVDRARAAQAESWAAGMELAAAVTSAYFSWQADQQRVTLAQERVDVAERLWRTSQARKGAGLDRDEAVQRAAATRASAAEWLAVQQGGLELDRVLLAALLGASPADLPALTARALPVPAGELPVDLGIDLLARRADIIASRWRVDAAIQDVKAARARFLPDFSLNALASLSSIEVGRLFESGSRAPAFGAAIHLPVFGAGTLRAQHGARQAELRAAVANYERTVINAAREVGEQIALRQQLAARGAARSAQSEAVVRLLAAARRRVEQGLADRRAELDAMLDGIEQRTALLELQAAAVAADVALARALGGGFDNSGTHS